MALSAIKKMKAYDDKESGGNPEMIKRLSLAQATPDNIRTTSLKVDNDTRPYSTPNAYYSVNAVSPIVTAPNISSLDADIANAKARAAEKATSQPLGGAVAGAMMGLTNPINGVAKDLIQIQPKDSGTNPVYQNIGTAVKAPTPTQTPTQTPSNNVVSISPYQKSQTVIDAENYLNQLRNGLNGRSQYADTIDALIAQYQNRDKFSYDPNADMLYQNYLAAMQNNGLRAMKDTMGQASALTGGYGSTYATAAANGAYNNYLQTANDNLQNFYNNALNAYNLEGEEMLNNLKLYQNLDDRDYQRKLQEYEMALNNANTAYDRDWNAYQFAVNQANTEANRTDSNYWKQKNYELDVAQNKLNQEKWAFDKELAEKQYDDSVAQMDFNNKDTDRKYLASLGLDSNGQPLVQSSSNSSAFSNSDMNTWKKQALESYNMNGKDGLYTFLEGLDDKYGLSDEDWKLIASYVESNAQNVYNKTENHWGKKNDKYEDSWGNTYTYEELVKKFGKDEAERIRKSV